MAKAVLHTNHVDDGGQVFCFKNYDIVALDGPYIAKECWSCPLFADLAGGYGVSCLYVDDNLGKGVTQMTYRNAEDARDHAPEKKDTSSVADKLGKKALEARLDINPSPEAAVEEVKKDKEDAAAKDQETAAAAAEDAPEIAPVQEITPPVEGTVQLKKATVADIIGAITSLRVRGETKHLPGRHDQQAHAGEVAGGEPGDMGTVDKAKKQFEAQFPIRKDLNSMRTKGTIQEDIASAVEKYMGGTGGAYVAHAREVDKEWGDSFSGGYTASKDGRAGVWYSASSLGSIPEFKVGVKTQEDWAHLRDYLRGEGLVR